MESAGVSMSLLTAASGVVPVHTLKGPDHYQPFVILAGARTWLQVRAGCAIAASVPAIPYPGL